MTTSIRIGLVCAEWPPESSGGATFERDVLRAVLEVPSTRSFTIYPDSAATRAIVDEAGAASRATLIPALTEPGTTSRVLRRAARTLRREPAPAAFSALGSALASAGAQCAWLLGGSIIPLDCPYVATIWDLQHRVQPWFPEVSSGGEWRERERLYSEFVRRAAAIVVGTESGEREIDRAFAPPGRTQVIPLPTPTFALAAADSPMPPRPPGVPSRYLLYPAQFWAHKNHVTAVRALASMDFADAPGLVLIGADRGTRAHVMQVAESLDVGARVHMPGFVDRSTLVSLYRHADALLFPSLFGPDNLPPLEAMALGCPVIAARVPGSVEQLGDAAILVDGLDAQGYVEAVRSLRDAATRDALVERGYRRARQWTAAQYAIAGLELIDMHIAPFRSLWP